jgi:hypothetical protein
MSRWTWHVSWSAVVTFACVARNPAIYPEAASRMVPDNDAGGVFCHDNRECGEGTYCSQPGCDGKGRCALLPTITNDVFRPVCACNARVYGNDDAAHQQALSVSHYLHRGEASGRDCEPHFVCRDHEPVQGVDCSR